MASSVTTAAVIFVEGSFVPVSFRAVVVVVAVVAAAVVAVVDVDVAAVAVGFRVAGLFVFDSVIRFVVFIGFVGSVEK